MLRTVKDYILNLSNQTFSEFWVEYLIHIGEQMYELEIKSISEKDLTIDNLQRELYDLGKEMLE